MRSNDNVLPFNVT